MVTLSVNSDTVTVSMFCTLNSSTTAVNSTISAT
jgi:hypothetical protein